MDASEPPEVRLNHAPHRFAHNNRQISVNRNRDRERRIELLIWIKLITVLPSG